jgi:hypothetical protein
MPIICNCLQLKGCCNQHFYLLALWWYSEGRLKSPPIDGFSWSKSIAGDFNRPSDIAILLIHRIAAFLKINQANHIKIK